MGCLRGGETMSESRGQGPGPRPPAGNLYFLGSGSGLRQVALEQDRQEISPSHGSRMGVRRTGGSGKQISFLGLPPDRVCAFANVYDKTANKHDDSGYESLPCDDRYAEAAPAGSFKPNAFGLYDMLGNVSEWTEDCLPTGLQWRGAPLDGTANLKGDCSQRAYRGGS